MTTPDAGILGNLGLENVPDDLADGLYVGWVYDCKVVTKKDNKGQSLVFTYKVDQPGSPFHGESKDEWKSINPGDDNTQKRFLKERLESLGVPSTRFSSFTPQDVIGQAVEFSVKTNGQYKNITSVKLRNATSPSVPASGPAAGQPTVATANPTSAGSLADRL